MFFLWRLSFLLVMILIFQSCSVFQYADLTPFPRHMRTIFIQNFRNETFQPDIHQVLTRAVRNEFLRRDNFIVVENRQNARLLLSAVINVYRKEGRLYDDYRNPTRYELIAGGVFELRENPSYAGNDRGARKLLSTGLTSRVDYSVSEGFPETEVEGMDRLADRLARQVATAVEAEFVSRYSLPPEDADVEKNNE